MDILKYKEYEGSTYIDMTKMVCRGKILFIDDLVTYEASCPADLQKEFEAAVDDYIQTCAELKREPQKPLKGQFNVRVPVELHRAAYLKSLEDETSLNDIMVRALQSFLSAPTQVNHHVRVTLINNDAPVKTMISGTSIKQSWGVIRNVH